MLIGLLFLDYSYPQWTDYLIGQLYNINIMLFGKLLDGGNEGDETDLTEMEQELRLSIDKVKAMAATCRISSEDEGVFETNAAGVHP